MVMPTLFKKFALIFLSSILFLNSMAMPFAVARAADPVPSTWYMQNLFDWGGKVYDDQNPSEIFGERYTAAQVQWIFYSMFWGLWNLLPGNPELTLCFINKHPVTECALIFDKEVINIIPLVGEMQSDNKSGLASFFSIVESNPISGIRYTKNLISKFNPVTEVNAQGFGFNTGADSIKVFWQATRNISYALIVLAVITMAFLIMFRIKMSPQLVISVQSALPNIIFATVLITFSYAIAGFAIDLMYVAIGLIASLLTSNGFSNDNFAQMFKELTTGHGAITMLLTYWLDFLWAALLNIFTSEWDFIIAIIMFLFAFISILFVIYWSFKIIVVIFKNFAMLMLTIAIGPLEILSGAFTGKSTFGTWFKKLLSILIVYPLLGLIFFFSFFFLWQGNSNGTGYAESQPFNVKQGMIKDQDWVPPFSALTISSDGGPSASDGLIYLAVSFLIFSQATKVIEIVQSLMSGKPFAYGSAIGEATEGAGGITKTVSNFAPAGVDKKIGALGDAVMTLGRSLSK